MASKLGRPTHLHLDIEEIKREYGPLYLTSQELKEGNYLTLKELAEKYKCSKIRLRELLQLKSRRGRPNRFNLDLEQIKQEYGPPSLTPQEKREGNYPTLQFLAKKYKCGSSYLSKCLTGEDAHIVKGKVGRPPHLSINVEELQAKYGPICKTAVVRRSEGYMSLSTLAHMYKCSRSHLVNLLENIPVNEADIQLEVKNLEEWENQVRGEYNVDIIGTSERRKQNLPTMKQLANKYTCSPSYIQYIIHGVHNS